MYQGTTPTLVLTIAGHDLTDANVFVTLENGKKQWTLEGDRLTIANAEGSSTITISFSQEETFRLPTGTMKCQVRWVTSDNAAYVTDTVNLSVNGVLLQKVITYENAEEEEEQDAE